MTGSRSIALVLLVLVAVSTWVVYAPALGFDFVRYDDPEYVSENPQILQGLTAESLRWALTASHGANWHPLTTFSHLLDVELHGLDPGRHHRTNVLLHVLNAMLVFAVLRAMTGACWRSLTVALLFALHPLHVESVAWVSARKDLLCCAFGLLSLAAYVRYVRRDSWMAYGAAVLLLSLGLLSKSMLVTWPFVFLLFDDWPLRRISGAAGLARVGSVRSLVARLILEKGPMLLLALGSCIVTYAVQRSAGAMAWSGGVSEWGRLANVPLAYLHYIRKAIWPDGLAVLYPHPSLPGGVPASPIEVALASLLLLAITGLVLRQRDRGYLRVGWLFFLGTLVPVIGVVQVGAQAAADRYTYVPLLGLFIVFSWSVGEWVERSPASTRLVARAAAVSALAVVLVALGYASRLQLASWRSSIELFEATLAATGPNPVIENELGVALQQLGDHERAIEHFRSALAIDPEDANTHNNLAVSLLSTGRPETGERVLRQAIALDVTHPGAYLNLGLALLRADEIAEAELSLSTAVQLDPESSIAMSGLARVLLIHPDPGRRDPARALVLAERAVELSHEPGPIVLDTLAAAYASAGRFDEAVDVAARALKLATASGDPDAGLLARRLRRLEQLRAGSQSGERHRAPLRMREPRSGPL